jgi:hypothetical protein
MSVKHCELKKVQFKKSGIFKKQAKGNLLNDYTFLKGQNIYSNDVIKAVVDDVTLSDHPLMPFIVQLSNKLDHEVAEKKNLLYLVFELQQRIEIQEEQLEMLQKQELSPNSSSSILSPKYQSNQMKINEIKNVVRGSQKKSSPRSYESSFDSDVQKVLPRSFSEDKKRTSERAMRLPISKATSPHPIDPERKKSLTEMSVKSPKNNNPSYIHSDPERKKSLTEKDLIELGKKVDRVASKRIEKKSNQNNPNVPQPFPTGSFKIKKNPILENFIQQADIEREEQLKMKQNSTRKRSLSLSEGVDIFNDIQNLYSKFYSEDEDDSQKHILVEMIVRNDLSSPRNKNKIKVVLHPSPARSSPILRDELKPSELMAKFKKSKK